MKNKPKHLILSPAFKTLRIKINSVLPYLLLVISFSFILSATQNCLAEETPSKAESPMPSSIAASAEADLPDQHKESIWQTMGLDLISPFSKAARPFTYTGLSATGLFIIFGDKINNDVQQKVSKHKPLGDFAEIGDISGQLVPNLLYAGGMFTHYWFSQNKRSYGRAKLMFKSSLYSGMVTLLLKNIVRQPRPNGNNNLSFPSGHTTSAFAFASVVGMEHNIYYGVAAYGLATLVGFSRINDNAHYLHDVIGGIVVGTAYGIGLHSRSELSENKQSSALNFEPIWQRGHYGLKMTYIY